MSDLSLRGSANKGAHERRWLAFTAWALGACLLVAVSGVRADNDLPCQRSVGDSGRPSVGLVLGGGGARGAAHVGVLRVLEEMHVRIDCIAGTSMGAIVGGLYASGLRADQIAQELETINWAQILDDTPPRPARPFRRKRDDDNYLVKQQIGLHDGDLRLPLGAVQGQKFDIELSRLTEHVADIDDFDKLGIPFRAVATDIETGEAVVLASGSLERSIHASMAVPGAFEAVTIGDHLLVDGFVSNNLPINVVRDMGADIIIAVDVGSSLKKREEITGMVALIGQVSNILSRQNVDAQIKTLRETDILVRPQLGNFSTSNFNDAGKAIALGEAAADAARAEFRAKGHDRLIAAREIAAEDRDPATVAGEIGGSSGPVTIAFIEIENDSAIGEEVLLDPFKSLIGKPFDRETLVEGLAKLYGWEVFQSVRYDIVRKDGAHGLRITVVEKAWGPDYLQLGVALASDMEGGGTWNIGASLLKTALNERAGEMRLAGQIGDSPLVLLDYYQPLDVALNYFFETSLSYGSYNVGVYSRDTLREELRLFSYAATAALGRVVGDWGEARLGIRRYFGTSEIRIGDSDRPDEDFDGAQVFARLSYDTLDNRNFPRTGTLARWEWIESVRALDADVDYTQSSFEAQTARTRGRDTLIGAIRFDKTTDGRAPAEARFRAGGFTSLSGFEQNQLDGQHVLLLKLAYYRRLNDFKFLPLFAGVTLEYGNVFERRGDISLDSADALGAGSVFLGMDTVLGPVYFSYGHAERGHDSVYLYLGRLF
jgi:NTE family protein